MESNPPRKLISKASKPSVPMSPFCKQFFSGGVRDRTTDASRKAAKELAILNAKQKNPGWTPVNSKGCRVNVRSIDVSKAREKIGDRLPVDVTEKLVTGAGGSMSGTAMQQDPMAYLKHPLREEARQTILQRMKRMSESGSVFEEGVLYEDNADDVQESIYLVRGIDPAAVRAFQRGEEYVPVRNDIVASKRDWIATFHGFFSTAKYGTAWIHSSGAITMLSNGRQVKCKCGATHSGM